MSSLATAGDSFKISPNFSFPVCMHRADGDSSTITILSYLCHISRHKQHALSFLFQTATLEKYLIHTCDLIRSLLRI